MVPHARKDFKQQGGLPPKALKFKHVSVTKCIFMFLTLDKYEDKRFYLNEDIQLSGSPLIQWHYTLTDQWAEIETQLKDLVQTVEHLKMKDFIITTVWKWMNASGQLIFNTIYFSAGAVCTGFRRMKDWASRLLRKWSWASRMLSKSLVELICWSSWENWDSSTSTYRQTTIKHNAPSQGTQANI